MPIRGERGAPTFDQKRPNDLGRYFIQLETLFTRCEVASDAEKKQFAVSFVESEVADCWKALPEFLNENKTYAQFKQGLFKIYNQVSLRYILPDLDRLVSERQRAGLSSLQDLAEFHLRFNAIASYLLANQLISAREQSQAYMRVFDDSLQMQVMMRLQISHPAHHPALPYTIDDIRDAATWVLQGASNTIGTTTYSAVPAPQSASQLPTTVIKPEQLGSFFTDLAKTIAEAVKANNPPRSSTSTSAPRSVQRCNFDGCESFIRDCAAVEEYIRLGRCRRNFEGKVVLPSGAFVPHDIQGQYLRDRIDEWHRQHPNQLASGQLFNAVISAPFETAKISEIKTAPAYQLTARDRIAALEAELFSLKVHHQPGFVPIIKTRRQRANEKEPVREACAPSVEPEPVAQIPVATQPEPRPSAQTSNNTASAPVTTQPARASVEAPEHPFRNAKDAVYTPPQNRNVGAPAKVPAQVNAKRSEPAYRTAPAIHDAKIATDVYQRALETPVTITYHELLSLAPEVRAQVRDAITSKRVQNKDVAQANVLQENQLTEEEMSYLMPDEELVPFNEDAQVLIMPFARVEKKLPNDAIIVEDPIDQYYKKLGNGETPDPDRLIVAKESSALRSITPLIDSQMKVEAILDPGCQIVAMSEDVCHELALPYDPTIILNMQSANGSIDPSLGLARNVPFLVGDLTFYMQVHVIRNPAYDILLGRPFDVLTQSVIRNFRNEDQTLMVHDPNLNRVATIPTIPRGPPRVLSKYNQTKCNHAGFR